MESVRSHDDISGHVEVIPVSAAQGLNLTEVSDFVYVRCNIPGPDTPRTRFTADFEGCGCKYDSVCDSTCACIGRFGRAYDEGGRLTLVDPYSDKMKPIYECNKACCCAKSCSNRVVQHSITHSFQVFETANKGCGLKTLAFVAKDSFVCEYAGEVISRDVARKRTQSLKRSEPNYILVLREHMSMGEVTTYVDPTYIGNLGRFINHSCQPNLYMVPIRVDTDVPHVALFAIRDITENEELTFDYSGSVRNPTNPSSKNTRQEVLAHESECHCNSQNCRGVLPFDTSLYED